MIETFRLAWEMYMQYNGTAMHMGLFLAALLFVNAFGKTDKEKANAYLMSGYAVLFFGIYFCPLTAKIIMDYCIGAGVYWRMFWILPIPLVVAYVFSACIKGAASKWARAALFVCMAVVIMITGAGIYTPENFSKAENIYKVPQDAVDVCNIISENADKNGIREKKAIMVNELLPYIRQYDASIKMPYGRNALKNEPIGNKNGRKIFKLLCEAEVDFQSLVKCARKEKYNYLVFYRVEGADESLRSLGYERVGDTGGYFVYRWKE